jgi:soluble lytic murein transglycosylase-like protein
MRVRSQRLTTGIVCGLASVALSPAANALAATPASAQPASPPAAIVPDPQPPAAVPAPATTTGGVPVDPQAPLDLTEPEQVHAVEDPAQMAKPRKPPRRPAATKSQTDVKPAEEQPAQPQPGAGPPPSADAGAALATIPALPRSGVPSYFIDSFRIPVFLLPILQAAGTEYGVRWEVLAAINEIETDYGRNLNVSSAGATGWMQFMPATWAAYGVDANRDGSSDPYNPVDAIFAAARYLQAAGAQTDLPRAIFAYNHAGWYVTSVLERAQRLAALPADLVGALTGLASGRSPVLGQARPLAALAASSRTLRLRVSAGARVVSVADARVVRVGRSDRLGRYVRLRDVFGNTYTYGGLSRLEQRFPVLRPAPRGTADPTPAKVEQDAAPSMPATAGAQQAAPAVAKAAAKQPAAGTQPAAAGQQAAPAAGAQPAAPAVAKAAAKQPAAAGRPAAPAVAGTRPAAPAAATPTSQSATPSARPASAAALAAVTRPPVAGPPRTFAEAAVAALAPLFADPTLPLPAAEHNGAARLAGPLATLDWGARARRLGIGLTVSRPARPKPAPPARPTPYDRRLLGDVPASRVTYRPLREGSRVLAGTILGRAERPTDRRARVLFEIRPAGRSAARIDPAPIVAGWKLLQMSSAGSSSLGVTAQPSIGQVMLLGKQALERLVLANPRIAIYPCGREDVRAGRVDRRVLATLQLLAMSGLSPTVSSLQCGHGRLTTSGNVSEHFSGNAVDISAINGTPILGNQGAGSITDTTIRRLLTLQGAMAPHQIISLMRYAEASNTMALADHADHIHVGFTPQTAPGSLAARLFDGVLEPKAWQRLVDRLAAIENPRVAIAPSAAAILAIRPARP